MVTVVVAVVVLGDTIGEVVGSGFGATVELLDGTIVGVGDGNADGKSVGDTLGRKVQDPSIVPSSSRSIIKFNVSAAALHASSPLSEAFRSLDAVQTSMGWRTVVG